MNNYPYATLEADRWLRCDRLHRPGFLTLLWDVLHHFVFTGRTIYHGHLYREFERGRCEDYVDIPPHPSDPSLMAWFATAMGDDLDDALERAAHLPPTEFCERHLLDTTGTLIALFPI
jgi:hypothetical protein